MVVLPAVRLAGGQGQVVETRTVRVSVLLAAWRVAPMAFGDGAEAVASAVGSSAAGGIWSAGICGGASGLGWRCRPPSRPESRPAWTMFVSCSIRLSYSFVISSSWSAAPFVLRCSTFVQPLKHSMALARPEPVPTYYMSVIS